MSLDRSTVLRLLGEADPAPIGRPRPAVAPYAHPSEGSSLILLSEPSRMTQAHIGQWANFNKRG